MLAARSDRQVISSASRRRPARKSTPLFQRGLGFVLRNPGGIAAGLLLGCAAAAITTNALINQARPHPAPLFADRGEAADERGRHLAVVKPAPLPPVRVQPAPAPAPRTNSASPEPAPAPSRAPSARDAIGDLIRTGETGAATATQASVRMSPVARPTAAREAGHDPIAAIIRGNDPDQAGMTPPAELSGRVAAAQRALARLGYGAIEADGLLGPATRQAIERFERDRKLPVTGDLNARTARALGERAGFSIE